MWFRRRRRRYETLACNDDLDSLFRVLMDSEGDPAALVFRIYCFPDFFESFLCNAVNISGDKVLSLVVNVADPETLIKIPDQIGIVFSQTAIGQRPKRRLCDGRA